MRIGNFGTTGTLPSQPWGLRTRLTRRRHLRKEKATSLDRRCLLIQATAERFSSTHALTDTRPAAA